MASKWKNIKEAIYDAADAMDPAGGYHYSWDTGRRVNRNYESATFIIQYPVNTPFEANVSRLGGVNSFQYRKRRRIQIVGRIPSDLTVAVDEDVDDKMNDALDKALEDITTKFNGAIFTELCEQGVKVVEYVSAIKRPLSSNGIYFSHELVVSYDIDYVQQR